MSWSTVNTEKRISRLKKVLLNVHKCFQCSHYVRIKICCRYKSPQNHTQCCMSKLYFPISKLLQSGAIVSNLIARALSAIQRYFERCTEHTPWSQLRAPQLKHTRERFYNMSTYFGTLHESKIPNRVEFKHIRLTLLWGRLLSYSKKSTFDGSSATASKIICTCNFSASKKIPIHCEISARIFPLSCIISRKKYSNIFERKSKMLQK